MFLSDLFNSLREVGFGLAQSLRAGDFGPGLLDGLMGQFNRLLDRRIERLLVLFSHDPGLLAQWGHSLAVRDPAVAPPPLGLYHCLKSLLGPNAHHTGPGSKGMQNYSKLKSPSSMERRQMPVFLHRGGEA